MRLLPTPRRHRPGTTTAPALRHALLVPLVAGVVTASATTAWAQWSAAGAGTGSATLATLRAPSNLAASPTLGTVHLTWDAAELSTGVPATGYYTTRSKGVVDPSCGTPAAPVTATSCTDTGVADGSYNYTVTAVYRGWTATSAPSGTVTVVNDATAPTVTATLTPGPNGNGYNNTSPVTVALNATDNPGGSGVESITSWVDDGQHSTVHAVSATVTVTGDGTHVVSYFATDNAGNSGTTTTRTVRLDTSAPNVAIASVTNPVNTANKATAAASGTVEAGATVSVVARDSNGHTSAAVTAAVTGTSWTAGGINVTALDDGAITYSATATDPAGNSTTVTATASKDTSAPAVSVTASTSPINNPNKASTSASGTVEPGATVTVVASDGAGGHATSPARATVDGSTWTVSGINVTALNDGTITYTATATDPAGNTGTATRTASKNTSTHFTVTTAATQTAGAPFNVTITAQTADGSTDTTYTGTKTVAFSGPANSPSGSGPTYPTNVTFANGVSSGSVTLTRAEAVALTATESSVTGTSPSITVGAGAPARLAWSNPQLPSGSVQSEPCLFTCTASSFGNNSTFTSSVSVTDVLGNTVSNLGSGHTVAVSTTGGGTLTAGTSLTISPTGPAVSTIAVKFKSQPGNSWSDALNAAASAGTPYLNATAAFSK